MNTTDELLEATEVVTDAATPVDADVNPIEEGELEIPEDFFADVKDEEFVATDAEDDDADIFQMDFSDVEKDEAKEAEREAKKALRKQMRRLFPLLVRILVIVLGPILVLSIFYTVSSRSSAKKLTHQLVQGEMEAVTLSAVEAFTLYGRGDYSYVDGVFYKGAASMEPMYEYLDYMSEKARTLDTLGLGGYTMEQLLKIL